MNEETLTALNASIEHWQRMIDGTHASDERPTGRYCALCQMFAYQPHSEGVLLCEGCPVAERAGATNCYGTPYTKASSAYWRHDITAEEFKEAARRQLQFLKSLRPRTKGKT